MTATTHRWRTLLLVAMLVAPTASPFAQVPGTPPHIAFVAAAHPPAVAARVQAFRQGLKELGYVEGRTITVEYRYAEEKVDRLPGIVADLVRRNVAVIVSAGPSVTQVARRETTAIPIVMAFDSDPVGSGAVASLSRPGGNVTGLSILATDLAGKQLELLKAFESGLARVAVFENSREPGNTESMRAVRQAAARLGITLEPIDVTNAEDVEPAFAEAVRRGARALVVLSSPQVLFHRARFAELAVRHRLPSIYPYPDNVDAGGLMMYGVAINELFRRSATLVDRILKGARPGDLPVEQPARFELAINLKTAQALGLSIPEALLQRADLVIR